MNLKHSYTLIAPFYDAMLTRATEAARAKSLAPLALLAPQEILLLGIGTGLDLPHLEQHAPQHRYLGVDLTAAMLRRAQPRRQRLTLDLLQADVQRLPLADAAFDTIILHLILAVAPAPTLCLQEAVRVLRPGGQLLVFDKFLKSGEGGWRRWASTISRQFATHLDVVFEDVLATVDGVHVISDQPALAGGWFRLIRLKKT